MRSPTSSRTSTRTTKVLADRAPDLADAIADARIAVRQAGVAAERVGGARRQHQSPGHRAGQARPRRICARRSPRSSARPDNLDAMVSDARPGIQNFSKSTLPEANRLVRDLRELSQSLQGRVRTGRAGRHWRNAGAGETARLQTEERAMRLLSRVVAPAALALAIGGCSLGGMLGGGGKAAGDPADPDAGSAADRANSRARRTPARR